MKTPTGRECKFFYGDYYRGRSHEECRMLTATVPPSEWTRDLCATCPVPGILLANDCQNMILNGSTYRPFLVMKRRVKVTAFCTKTNKPVAEPHIGCGSCHPLPFTLESEKK